MKARKVVATLLLTVFSFYEIALPFTFLQEKIVIAIVDFQNTSADDTLDYLEKTIPESISTTMAKGGQLEIVERSRLEAALKEMEMGMIGIVDEETAVELGRAVGASAILVGSFVSIGSILRINARLIDVQTSKVIKAESVQGRVGEEIFDLMDQMAVSMEAQLVGAPQAAVVPPTEPEPEQPAPAVIPPAPAPVPKKKSGKGILWLLVLAAGGAAGYYYYTNVLNAPATVTVNVNIEP
ncbi:MAG: CsgG/HfaB family protein [Candidatus Neomarinimicrobiota bacterium]